MNESTAITILGHKIYFPHGKTPFVSQMAVMSKVLHALNKGENALLESPTGTGKTLALLTSALTWQKRLYEEELEKFELELLGQKDDEVKSLENQTTTHKKPKKPTPKRIYYCSRTHSQLQQVIEELQNCHPNISDGLKMSILGSRSHLCVHEKLRVEVEQTGGISLDEKCRELGKEGACPFSYRLKPIVESLESLGVWDIEEAVKVGKKLRGCSYYAARHVAATNAQLVFAPYNFLLQPSIRSTLNIDVKDAIVIFDEAHNIEDMSRSAASFDILKSQLESMESQLRVLKEAGTVAIQSLHELVCNLLSWVSEVASMLLKDGDNAKADQYTWDGSEILSIFEQRFQLTEDTLAVYEEHFKTVMSEQEDAFDIWKQTKQVENGESDNFNTNIDDRFSARKRKIDVEYEDETVDVISSTQKRISSGKTGSTEEVPLLSSATSFHLQALLTVFRFMLRKNSVNATDYRLVVEKLAGSPNRSTKRRSMDVVVKIYCLNAAVAFSDLKEAHSLLLTSGTLSPLDSFAGELGVEFTVRVEAGHVIKAEDQVMVAAVSSFTRVALDATYRNQQDVNFVEALGRCILDVARSTPGGVLVFLPSYSFLDRIQSVWTAHGVFHIIEMEEIPVFMEPRDSAQMDGILKKFYSTLDDAESHSPGSGKAIFLAVCRGKVSEGINFSDHYARAVMVVGIPFPSTQDRFVVLKREYQNARAEADPQLLNGEKWYRLQAFRAINQAVGRCIRHKADFGAIILCDPRFSQSSSLSQLSRWVKASVQTYPEAENMIVSMRRFFTKLIPTYGAHCRSSNITVGSTQTLERSQSWRNDSLDFRTQVPTQVETAVGVQGNDQPKRYSIVEAINRMQPMQKIELEETSILPLQQLRTLIDQVEDMVKRDFLPKLDLRETCRHFTSVSTQLLSSVRKYSECCAETSDNNSDVYEVIVTKTEKLPNAFQELLATGSSEEVWSAEDQVVHRIHRIESFGNSTSSIPAEMIFLSEVIGGTRETIALVGTCLVPIGLLKHFALQLFQPRQTICSMKHGEVADLENTELLHHIVDPCRGLIETTTTGSSAPISVGLNVKKIYRPKKKTKLSDQPSFGGVLKGREKENNGNAMLDLTVLSDDEDFVISSKLSKHVRM